MTLQVPGSRSLAVDIADRIAQRARDEGPDARLGTKADLRQEYGVAFATLNEALRMLESQGLVTMKTGPQGGVFSAQPAPLVRMGQAILKVREDRQSVQDALTVRRALEPLTVIEAALHRREEDLVVLRRRFRAVEEAVDQDMDFARAIWDFHRAIYAVSNNEILKSVSYGLLDLISNNVKEVVAKTEDQRRMRVETHRALLTAIESQDLAACEQASLAHGREEA